MLATDGGKGPVNAYGGSGITNQMIVAAGGQNALADVKGDYAEVSVEQISAAQPDAILVSEYATLRGEKMPTVRAKAAGTLAIARNSPAAKDDRVLPVPVAAQREAPGVERVALALTGWVQIKTTKERPRVVAVDLAQWRQVIGDGPIDLPTLSGGTSALLSPELGRRGTFDVMWLSPAKLTTQGVIDSVPGFYSTGQFLLVSREVLPWPAANTLLIKGDAAPAELARLVPSATVETQEQALAAIQADPLTGTVRSTLLVVTVALGVYALVAIVLSLVIGAPGRARAVSLLRTLGLSHRQAQRLTVLELLPMVLVTALAGLALGLALPAALGPGVDMSSYAGGLPVGDYSPGLLTPLALAAGLAVCTVLGSYAHTAIGRRRDLGAVLRVGDVS